MPFIKNISIQGKKKKPAPPVEIILGSISAGPAATHTIYVSGSGIVWGWGNNAVGQIGDNTSGNSKSNPVSVLGATKTFCQISTGNCHTLAIDKYGRVWAWGNNTNGQLGTNDTLSKVTPVSILGTTKTFCEISGGGSHTVAIDKNGAVWAWGYNFSGQLGNNATVQQITPVSLLGATKTFCQISGGNSHTLAIDKNGRAWAWGSNPAGQLGNNSTVCQRTPVSVLGATKTFCQISAGSANFSSGLDKNGRVWTWGSNSAGMLGINSIVSQRTPVSILGATKTFCKIAAGGAHMLAIDKNGRLWSWGSNTNGQLGDNSITSRRTPVSVLGATKTFCMISGGANHSVAIDKNGAVWAWGQNLSGQLGDNSVTSRLTPVRVCNI